MLPNFYPKKYIFTIFSQTDKEIDFNKKFFAQPDSFKFPFQYNIVGSMYICNPTDNHDYRLACDFLNTLKIKNIILITIIENPSIFEILTKEYYGYETNTDTVIYEYIIPKHIFWTTNSIKNFVLKKDIGVEIMKEYNDGTLSRKEIKPSFIIYKFEHSTWNEITSLFKLSRYRINLAGGTNVKRHIASPLHFCLLLFISGLERENTYKKITDSFHNVPYKIQNAFLNYKLTYKELKKLFEKHELIFQEQKTKIEEKRLKSNDSFYFNFDVFMERYITLKKLISQIEEITNNVKKMIDEHENKDINDNSKNKQNYDTKNNNISYDNKNNNSPFNSPSQKREYHSISLKDKNILNEIDSKITTNKKIIDILNHTNFELINDLISNTIFENKYEKQKEIENFYINSYRNKINEALKEKNFTSTNLGIKLINVATKHFSEALDNFFFYF